MPRQPAPEPPPGLLEQIRNERVVPFIGAGFSKSAQPQSPSAREGFRGMPTYAELLSRLLELAKTKGEIQPADEAIVLNLLSRKGEPQSFDRAATALREAVGQVPFYLMLREILEPIDRGFVGSLGHQFLGLLNFRRLVTVNYDRLLEGFTAPRHEVITPTDVQAFHLFTVDTRRGYILKLHGDITRPDTIPWGKTELLRYYGYDSYNNPLPDLPSPTRSLRTFLERLFAENSVLFLGTSLASSEGFAQVLKNLARDWGGSLPYRHYTLVPYDPALQSLRAEFSRAMNLEYVYYEPDEQHTQVWEFLSFLKAGRPAPPITPGGEWQQWYHQRERPDYLRAQLEREKTATAAWFLTPKLTNAIATPDDLDLDCREELLGRYDSGVIEQILAAMRQRATNLDRRLRQEGLEVRVLFLETELRKALDPARADRAKLARAVARYRHLLELMASTATKARVIPAMTSDDLKRREASFALIFNRGDGGPLADVTIAYSSQATNDFPEIHRVEVNSSGIGGYTLTFERFWTAARNETETRLLIQTLVDQAGGQELAARKR